MSRLTRLLLILIVAAALGLALSGVTALADQIGPGPNSPVADQIGPGT
jgi:hypothetical protein